MHRMITQASVTTLLSLGFATSAEARNYLVIVVDDVGVDKVSTYEADYPDGNVTQIAQTDTLDSLAAAGIRFTRGWSNPLCAPTRASVQTGAHPYRHGQGRRVNTNEPGLDPDDWDALAEVFSAGGHATGFFGKWQVGNEDAAGNIGNPITSPYTDAPHPVRLGWFDLDGSLAGVAQDGGYHNWNRLTWDGAAGSGTFSIETEHPTDALSDSAAAWIAAQKQPWLAFISYQAAHASSSGTEWRYEDTDPNCFRSPELACLATESCADEALSVYQGLIECMDTKIDNLLTGMAPATLDDTTILYASDNGTPKQQLEGRFRVRNRGKESPYESGVRVPYVVADGATWRTGAAGVITSPGRTSSATIHTTDLYATLIDDAFGQAAPYPDSRSFKSCFTNTTADCGWGTQTGYTETFSHTNQGLLRTGSAAIRSEGTKAIIHYKRRDSCLVTAGYDLDADPYENNRLPADQGLLNAFVALHAAADGWANNVPFCP